MKMTLMSIVVVSAVAATGSVVGDDTVQILDNGLWHGEQVDVSSNSDWWGVFPVGEGFELQPAPITMTLAYDGIMDAKDEKTGKQVTVPQTADPVFLVRGIDGLAQGPLEAPAAQSKGGAIVVGKTMDLRLRADSTLDRAGLYAHGKRLTFSGPNDVGQEDLEIVIFQVRNGKTTEQTLARIPGQTDGSPRLEWAGDLDRDGEMDLLLNVTNHYNVRHWVLFLSSAAKEGEVVGRVAEWRTTGC